MWTASGAHALAESAGSFRAETDIPSASVSASIRASTVFHHSSARDSLIRICTPLIAEAGNSPPRQSPVGNPSGVTAYPFHSQPARWSTAISRSTKANSDAGSASTLNGIGPGSAKVSMILASPAAVMTRGAIFFSSLANSNRAPAARALASAACFSAIPTLTSASRCASPLAVIARRMTIYSTISPTPISPLAIREPAISARSWGTYRTVAISTTIPKNIRSVALADHRSNSSSLWWASFFLWPKAEGPFADLTRRGRRRLIIALLFAAILLAIAVWMR
jgi:hypothetical protein